MKHQNRVWIVLTALVLLLGAMVVACSAPANKGETPAPANEQATPTPEPAALSGEALVQERCTQCHDLTRIQSAAKTREEWDATVTRMIGKGASLNETEKVAVLDYLAATYGK